MSVVFVEMHPPRLPGRLTTGLFPGFCAVVLTVSWARGSLPEAIYRGVLAYRAQMQRRDERGRWVK